MKVAITGKGGVGKTTLSSTLARLYADEGRTVLAADVDPEEICAIAREILPKQAGPIALKDYGAAEPEHVAKNLVEQEMEVSCTIFQLGYKGDAPKQGADGLRQELVAELAAEALLGNSSPLYAKLYREGLINAGFAYGYEAYPGCAILFAGGDSRDPEAVRAARAALDD